MARKRTEREPPSAVAKLGWRYHHLGIPHTNPMPGERYLVRLGVHVRGFESSPFGIEWMRFEPHAAIPDIVRTVPHLAFEVDDLDPLRAVPGAVRIPVDGRTVTCRAGLVGGLGRRIQVLDRKQPVRVLAPFDPLLLDRDDAMTRRDAARARRTQARYVRLTKLLPR